MRAKIHWQKIPRARKASSGPNQEEITMCSCIARKIRIVQSARTQQGRCRINPRHAWTGLHFLHNSETWSLQIIKCWTWKTRRDADTQTLQQCKMISRMVFRVIQGRQRTHRKQCRAYKDFFLRHGGKKEFTKTIPMNLLKLVKIYNGSMTPHRSDTSGVRRVKEGNTCRTHKVDYQKTGGTVRWTGITCATCTTRWPMARQHSKRDMARHSTDHQSPSEHWLSTSQLHRFSWLGTSWFATQTLGLLISACLSSKSRPWHVLLWTDPCCVAASSARFKCAGSGCLSFLVSSFSKNMIIVVCFHFLTLQRVGSEETAWNTKRDPRGCLLGHPRKLDFRMDPRPSGAYWGNSYLGIPGALRTTSQEPMLGKKTQKKKKKTEDSWSESGDRHHEEPRLKLHNPDNETFPDPIQTRRRSETMSVEQQTVNLKLWPMTYGPKRRVSIFPRNGSGLQGSRSYVDLLKDTSVWMEDLRKSKKTTRPVNGLMFG